MAVFNAICLKFGTAYGPDDVNRLYSGIARHTDSDLRFFCMTDDRQGIRSEVEILPLLAEPFHDRMFEYMRQRGWNAPFQKISVHRPGLIPDLSGPLVFFDLDVLIVGGVDELRDHAPGMLCMRTEWNLRPGKRQLGHGSVVKFEPERHGYIWEAMRDDPEQALELSAGHDQALISLLAEREGDFVPFPDRWIASFKYDCRPPRPLNLLLEPRLPPGAKVVCFHGRPKIHEAVGGYRADPLHRTRSALWLREAWYGAEG